MSAFKFAAIAVIGLSLAACAGNPETATGPKETTGTVAGAIGGAAIGSQFGGGTGGHVAGALIGAGLGALIGNRIGAALDDEDKQRAYAAQMDALERSPSGAPVSWKNPIPAATAPSFPAPPIRSPAATAVPSPTRSISTASRRPPAAPPAAIRTAPGRRSADPFQHA